MTAPIVGEPRLYAVRQPLVYVAGPISGDPWGCVRKATAVAAMLQRYGVLAYLPQLSVLHEMVDSQPYAHWIEHGLEMVSRCDGLWRIPGESSGADKEVLLAQTRGLPVMPAEHEDPGKVPSGALRAWLRAVWNEAG